jgi:hypothetical protein
MPSRSQYRPHFHFACGWREGKRFSSECESIRTPSIMRTFIAIVMLQLMTELSWSVLWTEKRNIHGNRNVTQFKHADTKESCVRIPFHAVLHTFFTFPMDPSLRLTFTHFPSWAICNMTSAAFSLTLPNLCGLVARAPGCYPRGPGFDSRRYQIFWVAEGLERGPVNPYEDK